MADKKINETLAQQRKAREDFLALKRMQQGELDAGPKPSEIAIELKTPMDKLKNIWFHDKWYILGVIAIAIIVAVCVTQCASKPKYDLSTVVYSYNILGDDDCKLIADYLSKRCKDVNGDGETLVNVVNCSYTEDSTDKQYIYTCNTKLQAILSTDASALLYITDAKSYEYLSQISDDNKLFEGEPLPLGEDFYSECDGEDLFTLPTGLQISCRNVSGTMIDKDKGAANYYEASKEILNKLSQGE